MVINKKIYYNVSGKTGIRLVKSILKECKPIPVGVRYSSNINCHINHRYGLKQFI